MSWDYLYDDNKNITDEKLTVTPSQQSGAQIFDIHYDYDALDALTQITYPSGMVISYAPDALGRPTKVAGAQPGGQPTEYITKVTYDSNGMLTGFTYGNGTSTTITLDAKKLRPELFTIQSPVQGSSDKLSLKYGYDPLGNTISISDIEDAKHNQTMGYDGLDRLITRKGSWHRNNKATLHDMTATYGYDPIGNITKKAINEHDFTLDYSPSNQTLLRGIKEFSQYKYVFNYDNYGNINTDGQQDMVYDDASNLINLPGLDTKYHYDGYSRRTFMSDANGHWYYFLYNSTGQLLVEQYTPNYDSPTDVNPIIEENIYLGTLLLAKKSATSWFNNPQIVIGTDDADVITGTHYGEEIYGMGGNDKITAVGCDALVVGQGGYGDPCSQGGLPSQSIAGRNATKEATYNKIYGDAGDDVIEGAPGIDHIDGGQGDDTLSGNEGDDIYYVNKGDGVDVIHEKKGSSSRVVFSAGIMLENFQGFRNINGYTEFHLDDTGTNRIHLANSYTSNNDVDRTISYNYSILFEFANGSIKTLADIESLAETSRDDAAFATDDGDNAVTGTEWNDNINGKGGNDTIVGNDGDDILKGSTGDDSISGGNGADEIYGGSGDDEISGGDSMGWGSANHLYGEEGNDTLNGGIGIDYIVGGFGNDKLSGGGCCGRITNGDMDKLIGGADDDVYYINTGAGKVYIEDESGIDKVIFRAGIKLSDIEPAAGSGYGYANQVTLKFSGIDEVTFNIPNDAYLIESLEFANGQKAVISDFGAAQNGERIEPTDKTQPVTLTGTERNDYISGGNKADVLTGGDGQDVIYGGDGNDRLIGGKGNDFLQGNDTFVGQLLAEFPRNHYIFDRGDGHDTILDSVTVDMLNLCYYLYKTSSSLVEFGPDITSEQLTLSFINNALEINFTDSSDQITILGWLDGQCMEHRLSGLVFTPYRYYSFDQRNYRLAALVKQAPQLVITNKGTVGNDILKSDDYSHMILSGYQGDDELQGAVGNDQLYGGEGNDKLVGFSGEDTLDGGAGNDQLYGGIENAEIFPARLYGVEKNNYIFSRGYQQDRISSPYYGSQENILLGEGVQAADIEWQRNDNDLVLKILGTDDQLTLVNWFVRNWHRFQFILADQQMLDTQQIYNSLKGEIQKENSVAVNFGIGNRTIALEQQTAPLKLVFAENVDTSMVTLEKFNLNLVIKLNNNTDRLTLDHWFIVPHDHLSDQWVFQNGSQLPPVKEVYQSLMNEALSVTDQYGHLNGFDYSDDTMIGFERDDYISGLLGDDQLVGAAGNDTLIGGGGNDTLRGDDGDDRLIGDEQTQGEDNYIVQEGNDGWSGRDILEGGLGRNWLSGGLGDDTYRVVFDLDEDTIVDRYLADPLYPHQPEKNRVEFLQDIALQDIVATLRGDNLFLRRNGSGFEIVIMDWIQPGLGFPIAEFAFKDGTVVTGDEMNAHIGVEPPPAENKAPEIVTLAGIQAITVGETFQYSLSIIRLKPPASSRLALADKLYC